MSKIKICGLTGPEDIYTVNKYKPDYIGFVFAAGSRRYITPASAARLKKLLSAGISAVGVFVNENPVHIAEAANRGVIDLIQLHGRETESDIQWLKTNTKKPVIKAVPVHTGEDIARWTHSSADYLLFDSGAGGTGQTFDWTLLKSCTKPFFLAGGIGIGNLRQALMQGAYAVDLSSGAETDGKKDPKKIAEIINIVRRDL